MMTTPASIPPLILVNEIEIEQWPHVPQSSKLWSLEYLRDTYKVLEAAKAGDDDREVAYEDEIRQWAFDLCIAYYGLCTFTAIVPMRIMLRYLLILSGDMKFRPSPLLNSPENICDEALVAYRQVVKRHREFEERFPNLIRNMMYVACLSRHEATACIAAHLRGENWDSEAVNHFGGVKRVLEAAHNRRIRTLQLRVVDCD